MSAAGVRKAPVAHRLSPFPAPPELEPLVDVALRLGAGEDVRERLSAYQ